MADICICKRQKFPKYPTISENTARCIKNNSAFAILVFFQVLTTLWKTVQNCCSYCWYILSGSQNLLFRPLYLHGSMIYRPWGQERRSWISEQIMIYIDMECNRTASAISLMKGFRQVMASWDKIVQLAILQKMFCCSLYFWLFFFQSPSYRRTIEHSFGQILFRVISLNLSLSGTSWLWSIWSSLSLL